MNQRIKYLDGLRGIAISWVILFHYYANEIYSPFVSLFKDISILKYGYLGVPLFFMISGFVILMTLEKSKNYTHFLKKRWLRLFPAMLLASLFIFTFSNLLFEYRLNEPNIINLIPGLFFINPHILNKLLNINCMSLDGVFWSLYIEVAFYIIIGFIYFFISKKHLLKLIFAIAFITFIAISLFNFNSITYYFHIFGFDYYEFFYIGCFIYKKTKKELNNIDYLLLVLSILIALLIGSFPYYRGVELNIYKTIFFSLSIIILFCYLYKLNFINKFLLSKPIQFLGFISYPLYLLHYEVGLSLMYKLHKQGIIPEEFSFLIPIPVTFLFLFIAYIFAKFLEPTLKNIFSKFLKSHYKKSLQIYY